MKVSALLNARWAQWRELEQLCATMAGPRWRIKAAQVARFAALYRAACADLALADAYQLPPGAVDYLHQLVAQAHNQLYRSRTFQFGRWREELVVVVPRRLRADGYLRLALLLFWGVFLLAGLLAHNDRRFAEQVVSKELLLRLEADFSEPIQGRPAGQSATMCGFYVFHNTTIGLRCFAFGLVFGVGGLLTTVFNAALLGAIFGHMAGTPVREHFFHFVTAHGPAELTAIVLAAAAGMRLGFALVDTQGLTRSAALRSAARQSMPVMGAAMALFFLAALIEGFLSPSIAPYGVKAAVAIVSAVLLVAYYLILGTAKSR
jgi:uncharacterized membrane protein SpoIIM required for sporulation